MPEEAEFIEAQEAIINRVLSGVSTAFPATIIAPSQIEGLVDVQPNHKFKIPGNPKELTPNPINNVPLLSLHRTSGKKLATIIRPPKESLIGTKVLCVTCEHSITEWRSSDGGTVFARENRRFDINDAVAIIGLYPETVKWSLDPQKPDTFEFLGTSGVKFHIGTSTADFLKIMYDFLEFFQTMTPADGDDFVLKLTEAQTGPEGTLFKLEALMKSITNI